MELFCFSSSLARSQKLKGSDLSANVKRQGKHEQDVLATLALQISQIQRNRSLYDAKVLLRSLHTYP